MYQLRSSGVLLSCRKNSQPPVLSHYHPYHQPTVMADWGKWSLARNLDRSWRHRFTSLKLFWPQPMTPWTVDILYPNIQFPFSIICYPSNLRLPHPFSPCQSVTVTLKHDCFGFPFFFLPVGFQLKTSLFKVITSLLMPNSQKLDFFSFLNDVFYFINLQSNQRPRVKENNEVRITQRMGKAKIKRFPDERHT